jgi:hypothetical protein
VQPESLLKENIPIILSADQIPDNFWYERIKDRNNFEQYCKNWYDGLEIYTAYKQRRTTPTPFSGFGKRKTQLQISPADLEGRAFWDDAKIATMKSSTTRPPKKRLGSLFHPMIKDWRGILWQKLCGLKCKKTLVFKIQN